MAEGNQAMEVTKDAYPKKRALGRNKNVKNSRTKKRPRMAMGEGGRRSKTVKFDKKMKKLIKKRARDYNSDEDGEGGEDKPEKEEEEEEVAGDHPEEEPQEDEKNQEVGDADEAEEFSDRESGDIQPGVIKFTEGVRAFRLAFKSIIKKASLEDPLGPVMSANKKLVAEKLAEEEAERKVKRESRKEKRMIGEKGHVKPESYLNLHEKFLIGVATKGVVKLFNAVNKAQNAQKGLNPSTFKDEKAIRKRRKEAFFSELKKTHSATASNAMGQTSTSQADDEGPAWAPLRDNYMLTNSKLKDWDKMPENTVTDDIGRVENDSSSDDD